MSENVRTTQIQGIGVVVFCQNHVPGEEKRPYLRIGINFENGQRYIYSNIDELLRKFEGRRVELIIKDTDLMSETLTCEHEEESQNGGATY